MTENSAISAYFKRIGSVPLLTREEEQALFARIEKGDQKARDELIERNLKLAVPTAKQYARCGIPFSDLVQEGSMAIAKACDKFDPSLGNKFSTYATYWIKQRIGRYVKKHVKNVFVPEHIVNLAVQIAKAKRALAAEGETEPTDERIAEVLDRDFEVKADAKTVRETLEFCQTETSMAAKVGEDGETEFGDLLEDSNASDPGVNVGTEMTSECLARALGSLTPRERTTLEYRYGFTAGRKGLSCAEAAELFGSTPAEVKRAFDAATADMRIPA